MPSGGHGGSGHCGGGSGGGGYHGGGSGGFHGGGGGGGFYGGGMGGGGRPPRHIYHMHGRPCYMWHFGPRVYYVPTFLTTLLSIFAVLIIVCSFAGFSLFGVRNSLKTEYNNYFAFYNKYQALIERANNNSDYLYNGVITYIGECGVDANKYYINYKVLRNDNTWLTDGFTYCTYSYSDILSKGYIVGSNILLALDCKNTERIGDFDSVNMDYGNTTLQDDADFVNLEHLLSITKYSQIVAFCADGILIVLAILFITKNLKKPEKETSLNSSSQSQTSQESIVKNEVKRCKYCGAIIPEGKSKCEQCGGTN